MVSASWTTRESAAHESAGITIHVGGGRQVTHDQISAVKWRMEESCRFALRIGSTLHCHRSASGARPVDRGRRTSPMGAASGVRRRGAWACPTSGGPGRSVIDVVQLGRRLGHARLEVCLHVSREDLRPTLRARARRRRRSWPPGRVCTTSGPRELGPLLGAPWLAGPPALCLSRV